MKEVKEKVKLHHGNNGLFDHIQEVRGLCSVVYDRGISQKKSKEEIAETITPMLNSLDANIADATSRHIDECVLSIMQFELYNHSLEEQIAYLREKQSDNQTLSDKVRTALHARMKWLKVDHLEDKGFFVTLTEDKNGQEIVSVR